MHHICFTLMRVKIHLSYSLFESKFEWLVKYNFDKVWAFKDKIEVDYIEKKTFARGHKSLYE